MGTNGSDVKLLMKVKEDSDKAVQTQFEHQKDKNQNCRRNTQP